MTACETYEIQERFFKTLEPNIIKSIKHDVQFDFWKTEQESELEAVIRELSEVKKSSSAVRRALFARNGELQKRMIELEDRLAILERGICSWSS